MSDIIKYEPKASLIRLENQIKVVDKILGESKRLQYGSFIDPRDGQKYKTIKIGEQVWMAENLKFYTEKGSWCYDDDPKNGDIYGRLYNWNTAMKVSPPGWHLPSDEEWNILVNYLGGEKIAGGKMKEAGYLHWKEPNEGADNSSGFSGLPAGFRYSNGSFYSRGDGADFWSSTETEASYAGNRGLGCSNAGLDRFYGYKSNGMSVRCLKDY